MQRSRSPKRRLAVEALEDRITPFTGVPWLNPQGVTISFAPDGADISGSQNNLSALLGGTPSATWKREVLRAFQTWAVQANVNVGLVADGGQPFGSAGAPQSDPRYGDIRVGARQLSAAQNDSVAGTTGFDYAGGTWSGDMVLNSAFGFNVGGTGGKYDLYSVALHEASHSFGLADSLADPASALYTQYTGVRAGLTAGDIAAIQALYGPRVGDRFEGPSGNDTLATATNLGTLTSLSADLNRVGDVDVYKFTAPSLWAGGGALTVNLQAAGISLLTAKVTVYDANGNAVASAATTDPLNNNLALAVPNYQPGGTYYVKVEGAGTDVFSAGAYVLKLSSTISTGTSDVRLTAPLVNYEGWSNDTQGAAAALTPVSAANQAAFALAGAITASSDVDWYKITPTGQSGTLTVSVWAWDGSALWPMVQVYNAAGQLVSADVKANEQGAFTVQIPNQVAGTTYYLKVTAAKQNGSHSTGTYVLGAALAPVAPAWYDQVNAATLAGTNTVASSTMTVADGKLTQFSLAASTAQGSPDTAVRMTIYDTAGRAVFTMVSIAGQPLSTGTVWLAAGSYTVVYNAATRTGAAVSGVTFDLRKRERSDPLDPFQVDANGTPTGSNTGGGSVITTTDVSLNLPPALPPLLDPIADPFAGL